MMHCPVNSILRLVHDLMEGRLSFNSSQHVHPFDIKNQFNSSLLMFAVLFL